MATSSVLGVDVMVTTDIDPLFRLCSGQTNLACALSRRLNSEAGCLADIGDDPDYGYDLRSQLLDETSDSGALGRVAGSVRAELLKDQRVTLTNVQIFTIEDK